MRRLVTISAFIAAVPLAAQLQQGVAAYEQGRLDDAKRILAPLANDAKAQATLGLIAMRQNDDDGAVAAFEKAVALAPTSAEYHFHLGEAYGSVAQKASFFKQATLGPKVRDEFEKAVQLDANYLDARFGLIDFYMLAPGIMGGGEDKAFAEAAEIKKRDRAMGHRAYARIYNRKKQPELVRKEWLDYVHEEPQSARAHTSLGTYLGMTDKKFKEGFDELDLALKLDATYMPAWFRVGQLAATSGAQLARGEEALRKYLTYTPKDNEPDTASTHYFLGMIYEKEGKKAEAKQAYAMAVKLNPTVKPFQEALKRMS